MLIVQISKDKVRIGAIVRNNIREILLPVIKSDDRFTSILIDELHFILVGMQWIGHWDL